MAPPTFLTLPPEIRDQIYTHLLSPSANLRTFYKSPFYTYSYTKTLLPVSLINRQIYLESRKTFHRLNTFVKIGTPWEQAKHHVVIEGGVNLLMTDEAAARFKHQSMDATLTAIYPDEMGNEQSSKGKPVSYFVVLAETGDLEKFCRSWFYNSVTMPLLNSYLELELELKDPFTSSSPFPIGSTGGGGSVEPQLSKRKQQMLLEPFGQIKALRDFTLTTFPRNSASLQIYPSLRKSLAKEMAIPRDPPELCLTKATALKDKGNAELTAGNPKAAVELYNAAFLAVHIVINGTERKVHGEGWFNTMITTPGPFENQHGETARIILRVRLVANTILAYLKLKDYEMAINTGMRTIKIMRTSVGLDEDEGASDPRSEAMLGFVAAGEMGKIYYRTGVAYKERDEKSEARKLLKVAAVYLPHDKTVIKDLASVALRLG